MSPETSKEAAKLLADVKKNMPKNLKGVKVILAPPFVYLHKLGRNIKPFTLGAQNVFWRDKGAFTGEISAPMLKSLGVKYVNIGHTERRVFADETDAQVERKVYTAIDYRITPIVCVGGAKKPARGIKKTKKLVRTQLKFRRYLTADMQKKILIAFEPQDSIGTGKAAQPKEIEEMLDFIRVRMPEAQLLYGGSVSSKNAKRLLKIKTLDGLLVGGNSLIPKEFAKIIKIATLVD